MYKTIIHLNVNWAPLFVDLNNYQFQSQLIYILSLLSFLLYYHGFKINDIYIIRTKYLKVQM